MTEQELYEHLMSHKEFSSLSPVTKEKLFNAYIKPLLEEIEGVRQWIEDLVRENTALKKEIDTLNKDYTAEVMGSQKIKKQLERRTLVLNIIAKSDPIGVGLDEITDIAEKGLDDD